MPAKRWAEAEIRRALSRFAPGKLYVGQSSLWDARSPLNWEFSAGSHAGVHISGYSSHSCTELHAVVSRFGPAGEVAEKGRVFRDLDEAVDYALALAASSTAGPLVSGAGCDLTVAPCKGAEPAPGPEERPANLPGASPENAPYVSRA